MKIKLNNKDFKNKQMLKDERLKNKNKQRINNNIKPENLLKFQQIREEIEKEYNITKRALKMGLTENQIKKIRDIRAKKEEEKWAEPWILDAKKIVEKEFKFDNLEPDGEAMGKVWYNLKEKKAGEFGYEGCGWYLVGIKDNNIYLEHIEYLPYSDFYRQIARHPLTLTAFGSCYQLGFSKESIERIKNNPKK